MRVIEHGRNHEDEEASCPPLFVVVVNVTEVITHDIHNNCHSGIQLWWRIKRDPGWTIKTKLYVGEKMLLTTKTRTVSFIRYDKRKNNRKVYIGYLTLVFSTVCKQQTNDGALFSCSSITATAKGYSKMEAIFTYILGGMSYKKEKTRETGVQNVYTTWLKLELVCRDRKKQTNKKKYTSSLSL